LDFRVDRRSASGRAPPGFQRRPGPKGSPWLPSPATTDSASMRRCCLPRQSMQNARSTGTSIDLPACPRVPPSSTTHRPNLFSQSYILFNAEWKFVTRRKRYESNFSFIARSRAPHRCVSMKAKERKHGMAIRFKRHNGFSRVFQLLVDRVARRLTTNLRTESGDCNKFFFLAFICFAFRRGLSPLSR